jgi:hypothetical protein
VVIGTVICPYNDLSGGYQLDVPLPAGSNLWVRQTGSVAKIQILALN